MAEEDDSQKTEEPTSKKLEDAHEKGEMASSQEVKTLIMLASAAAVLAAGGNYIVSGVRDPLRVFMGRVHEMTTDELNFTELLFSLLAQVFWVVSIPFAVFIAAAIMSNRVQNSFIITTEKIKPNISNLSLLKGAKKIFSARFFVEFGKITAKLITVGGVIVLIVYPERGRLDTIMSLSPAAVLGLIHVMAIKLIIGVLIIMCIIAAIDYSYQQYQFHKKMKMTKQEVKDERKQSDGDPKIKARLRQIRMDRHMHRMMSNVPKADVVITNPTHYAVALEYKHENMQVPVLLAKGVDEVAMRIREAAEEHKIPIIENPPLARALFASVDIDDEIHPDHYKAVAEVISYIMKLRKAGLKPRK
ncbi:flagellar biosynthesis protein FlhB [Kordiimonas pumila]|uniref:Flagellar biosynthetic protein FlhB n=1 Tax=Kordiimonas pumila TaxID=2161677 RepID=A0ABV7D1U1_9PROT|nr:flagellar biosynthesis protein FlhB [Kordiimonas pumila]